MNKLSQAINIFCDEDIVTFLKLDYNSVFTRSLRDAHDLKSQDKSEQLSVAVSKSSNDLTGGDKSNTSITQEKNKDFSGIMGDFSKFFGHDSRRRG